MLSFGSRLLMDDRAAFHGAVRAAVDGNASDACPNAAERVANALTSDDLAWSFLTAVQLCSRLQGRKVSSALYTMVFTRNVALNVVLVTQECGKWQGGRDVLVGEIRNSDLRRNFGFPWFEKLVSWPVNWGRIMQIEEKEQKRERESMGRMGEFCVTGE